jgi:hypothetical protein
MLFQEMEYSKLQVMSGFCSNTIHCMKYCYVGFASVPLGLAVGAVAQAGVFLRLRGCAKPSLTLRALIAESSWQILQNLRNSLVPQYFQHRA